MNTARWCSQTPQAGATAVQEVTGGQLPRSGAERSVQDDELADTRPAPPRLGGLQRLVAWIAGGRLLRGAARSVSCLRQRPETTLDHLAQENPRCFRFLHTML